MSPQLHNDSHVINTTAYIYNFTRQHNLKWDNHMEICQTY